MKKLLTALFLGIGVCTAVIAEEYVVISSKNMKDLSPTQIKAIYLKKLTLVDDIKVIPVNLGPRDEMRLKFEEEMLEMSFPRLKTYWTSQHYLGHRPPISMKSEESVKSFVKKVDGAVGYIKLNGVDESVKVMYKWSD